MLRAAICPLINRYAEPAQCHYPDAYCPGSRLYGSSQRRGPVFLGIPGRAGHVHSDWLDGYLARRLNQVTTFGKLIDPLADKIAVSAAFIYLTGEGLCPAWITILIISREFLVTGLRQIAQDHGVIIPAGTSGKWKTAFQLAFCIACLLALTWTHTPEYLPSITDRLAALCLWHGSGASNLLYQVTLWGSVILTVYSGAVYCAGARKFLQR